MSLRGRVGLVTGAGKGIGKSIAHFLASQGMLVAINDIRPELAEAAVFDFCREGLRALALPADVTHKGDVETMVERAESSLGPLWLLVNNAGVFSFAPTPDMSEKAWDEAFAVDAKGVFLCSQAAIRRMIPRHAGRIVNVSSIAGIIVRTNQIGYCSAKAATVHFSRCLAVEVAPFGITVNCVCPGMTHTAMLEQGARERGIDLEAMKELIPTCRLAKPEDHAQLIAYLASEEASQVTGQVIAVDGAQSQYLPVARAD